MIDNKKYMDLALTLAKKAFANGDIPVGAVIINKAGIIIGKGYNCKEKSNNPTKHAEMIAIQQACKKNRDWRLDECIIYSTLEPCLMCFGAIVQSRISCIVFGLESKKFGSINKISHFELDSFKNKQTSYHYLYQSESENLMQSFFLLLRTKNNVV